MPTVSDRRCLESVATSDSGSISHFFIMFFLKGFLQFIYGFPELNKSTGKEDEPQLKLRKLLGSRNSVRSCSPEVPLGLVFLGHWSITIFRSMFPRSSLVTQYPTLHRAVCAFRSLFAQVLKCGGCMIITVPKCTHFKPLGLGKVAGFFGSFCPRAEGACWFGILTRS